MFKKGAIIFDYVLNSFSLLAGTLIILVMLLVSAEVIMRYFFNIPIYWATEISEYSLLYITFLGTAWLLREDGHVKIDFLVQVLSGKPRAFLGIFSSAIGIISCAIIVVYGSQVTWDFYRRGVFNPTLLYFPRAYLFFIIPLGCLLLTIQFCRRLSQEIGEYREVAVKNEEETAKMNG
ncbi:MAG: TRAP transporter small permease [Bacillota bacterium]